MCIVVFTFFTILLTQSCFANANAIGENNLYYSPTFQDLRGLGLNKSYPGGNVNDFLFEEDFKEIASDNINYKELIDESKNNKFNMSDCKKIILHEISEYKNTDKYFKGESTTNENLYFCWPSDATEEEYEFFMKHGYISPETKDKIFPLGEREYINEPKAKMELMQNDKQ